MFLEPWWGGRAAAVGPWVLGAGRAASADSLPPAPSHDCNGRSGLHAEPAWLMNCTWLLIRFPGHMVIFCEPAPGWEMQG